MYRRVFAAIVVAVAVPAAVAAQDDMRKAFDEFTKQAKKEYADFREKANNEYAEALKSAWQTYRGEKPTPKPIEKKVEPVIIDFDENAAPVEDNEIEIDDVLPFPKQDKQPVPVCPIPEINEDEMEQILDDWSKNHPTEPVAPRRGDTQFELYGTQMAVRMPDGCNIRLRSVDNNEIAAAWQTLSGRQFNNTIRDCLEKRIDLQLSDWAYLCMLDALAEKVCGAGTNEATLMMAYLFCQSGYKMRLAVAGGKLYMLYGTSHIVYNSVYITIDGYNYCPYKGKGLQNFYVCNQSFHGEKAMSLFINKEQLFAGNTPERVRNSSSLNVRCTSNEGMIAFANDYPTSMYNGNMMSRWAMYANAPLSTETKNRLYPQLKAAIQGKSQSEQLQTLLSWLHEAFEYEYDDKVWGGDRAFFAEETLFYPYCDCEDRSILYTRLVRDLLGLKAILIYYPGHLACAIAAEGITGDYINLNGRRFLVCDPTYIGARIGQTMPGMDNQSAKVILLD